MKFCKLILGLTISWYGITTGAAAQPQYPRFTVVSWNALSQHDYQKTFTPQPFAGKPFATRLQEIQAILAQQIGTYPTVIAIQENDRQDPAKNNYSFNPAFTGARFTIYQDTATPQLTTIAHAQPWQIQTNYKVVLFTLPKRLIGKGFFPIRLTPVINGQEYPTEAINIFNVHVAGGSNDRGAQLQQLADALRFINTNPQYKSKYYVVAGDFNSADAAGILKYLNSSGIQFTHRFGQPTTLTRSGLTTTDHIFYSNNMQIVVESVVPDTSLATSLLAQNPTDHTRQFPSDHALLKATFALTDFNAKAAQQRPAGRQPNKKAAAAAAITAAQVAAAQRYGIQKIRPQRPQKAIARPSRRLPNAALQKKRQAIAGKRPQAKPVRRTPIMRGRKPIARPSRRLPNAALQKKRQAIAGRRPQAKPVRRQPQVRPNRRRPQARPVRRSAIKPVARGRKPTTRRPVQPTPRIAAVKKPIAS